MVNNNLEIDENSFKKIVYTVTPNIHSTKISFGSMVKKELKNNKLALISLIILAIVIVCVLLAPLSPYDPYETDATQKLLNPSIVHWFGTDEYGRDYFTRILYGGRISLLIGITSMAVTLVLGSFIGICSGYLGGKIDIILMRFTDIFLALPSMLLMIVLNTLLQPGLPTLILVLSLFSWPSIARITRAETMSIKERDYIIATERLGASFGRIAIKHILPNIVGTIVVAANLNIANAILMESSLSFLGLGVQIPTASWGSMLQTAQKYILNRPQLIMFPAIFIIVTVLGFNMLGEIMKNILEERA